jgi:hypothetical protein
VPSAARRPRRATRSRCIAPPTTRPKSSPDKRGKIAPLRANHSPKSSPRISGYEKIAPLRQPLGQKAARIRHKKLPLSAYCFAEILPNYTGSIITIEAHRLLDYLYIVNVFYLNKFVHV